MFLKKEYLDLVLVPFGLIIVLSYHLFLLYRILYFPYHTIIGFMNIDKTIWVERIMQASPPSLSFLKKKLHYPLLVQLVIRVLQGYIWIIYEIILLFFFMLVYLITGKKRWIGLCSNCSFEQHISFNIHGIHCFNTEFTYRRMDWKLTGQHDCFYGTFCLWRHKFNHNGHQIHLSPRVFSSRLLLFCSVHKVFITCELSHHHSWWRYPTRNGDESRFERWKLLVAWS